MKYNDLMEILGLIEDNLGVAYCVSCTSNGLMVQFFESFTNENPVYYSSYPINLEAQSSIIYGGETSFSSKFYASSSRPRDPLVKDLNNLLDVLGNRFKNKENLKAIKEKIRTCADMEDVLEIL